MPEQRSTVALDRAFSDKEMTALRAGVVPWEMEDKWFVYWQDDCLHFHRSWTGSCVYIVRFRESAGVWHMVGADLNRDPEQYTENNDRRDARLISYLIDTLLLERAAQFPPSGDGPSIDALSEWSLVGRAMLGGDTEGDNTEPE